MNETAVIEQTEIKPRSKRSLRQIESDVERSRVDISQALTLRLKHHLPYELIGQTMGVSAQAVQQRLKRFMPFLQDTQGIEEYETHKASLLSAAEMRLLESIVDETKIKEASLNNVAYAFQQVSNFNRLSRGESTENINLLAVQGDLKAINETKDRLSRELRSLQPTETSTDVGTIPNDVK